MVLSILKSLLEKIIGFNPPDSEEIAQKIGFEGYQQIAGKIRRFVSFNDGDIARICNRANEELPLELSRQGLRYAIDLSNDRHFYELARIPYSQGSIDLIKAAVAEYLLEHKREFGS